MDSLAFYMYGKVHGRSVGEFVPSVLQLDFQTGAGYGALSVRGQRLVTLFLRASVKSESSFASEIGFSVL